MNRHLYLHIGLHKTGSSAIQSWLARHAQELKRAGVSFTGFKPSAADGDISNGNGPALGKIILAANAESLESPPAEWTILIDSYFGGLSRAIVSSEMLSQLKEKDVARLASWCQLAGVELRVLAYVRHIYDHCYSAYQQHVKQNAYTRTFLEYSREYNNFQCRQIERWHAAIPDSLTVASYDHEKENLIGHFTKWANIGDVNSVPSISGHDKVNRSLCFHELELLRKLNAMHGGRLSTEIYKRMIQEDPNRKQDYSFSPTIYNEFVERFSPEIEEFNATHFSTQSCRLEIASPKIQKANEIPQEKEPEMDRSTESAFRAVIELCLSMRSGADNTRLQKLLRSAKEQRKKGDVKSAEKALGQVLRIDPTYTPAIRQLARIYDDSGRANLGRKLRRKIRDVPQAPSKPTS